jgi:hypothetical protein
MVAEDSVAEYRRTGIETNPKLNDSDAIERAAMRTSSGSTAPHCVKRPSGRKL